MNGTQVPAALAALAVITARWNGALKCAFSTEALLSVLLLFGFVLFSQGNRKGNQDSLEAEKEHTCKFIFKSLMAQNTNQFEVVVENGDV